MSAVRRLLANKAAETANGIAADALGEAREANRIALGANDIASDANTTAERALRSAQDDVPYNWELDVHDDGRAVVHKDRAHPALQATVVLDSGGQVVAEAGPTDLPAFEQFEFDVAAPLEKHFEAVRANPVRYAHSECGMFFGGSAGTPVAIESPAHLRWSTEQDVPRTDLVRKAVHHQMAQDGMKRWAPKKPKPER